MTSRISRLSHPFQGSPRPSPTRPVSRSGESEGILHYQKNRTLDRCPGFIASFQVESSRGERFFVGLRLDGLEIYTGKDRQYFFDLEGRPARFSTPNEYCFRGVSHRGVMSRKRSASEGGGFDRKMLTAAELDFRCREAWNAGREVLAILKRSSNGYRMKSDHAVSAIFPVLNNIEAFTPERLADETTRFAQTYHPVPVLPPDHYGSLVLQATEGCSFNTCTFCSLYRGIPYRVRTLERFEQHLLGALKLHGEGLRRFTQIFLGQANALAIPQGRLVSILECIGRHLELPPPESRPMRPAWAQGHRLRFLGIGSFLDGFTGLAKSVEDYCELRRLGLSRAYLGVESGSTDLLLWLRKPAVADEMQETLRRLKKAGISTDIILLVGVGGKKFAEEHVRKSLDFVRQSSLEKGDRVYLSEIREYKDGAYAQRLNEEGIRRLEPAELKAQAEELATGIRQRGLQAVPYRVEPFIY